MHKLSEMQTFTLDFFGHANKTSNQIRGWAGFRVSFLGSGQKPRPVYNFCNWP